MRNTGLTYWQKSSRAHWRKSKPSQQSKRDSVNKTMFDEFNAFLFIIFTGTLFASGVFAAPDSERQWNTPRLVPREVISGAVGSEYSLLSLPTFDAAVYPRVRNGILGIYVSLIHYQPLMNTRPVTIPHTLEIDLPSGIEAIEDMKVAAAARWTEIASPSSNHPASIPVAMAINYDSKSIIYCSNDIGAEVSTLQVSVPVTGLSIVATDSGYRVLI